MSQKKEFSIKWVFNCIMLLIIAIISTPTIYSNDLQIKFDFQSGILDPAESDKLVVKTGGHISFEIDKINLFKYEVYINGTPMNYNTAEPPVFSNLKIEPRAPEGPTKTDGGDSLEDSLVKISSALESKQTQEVISNLPKISNRLNEIKQFLVQLEKILYTKETFDELKFSKDELIKVLWDKTDENNQIPTDKESIEKCKNDFYKAKELAGKIREFVEDKKKEINMSEIEDEQVKKDKLAEFAQLEEKLVPVEELIKEFENNDYLKKLDHLFDKLDIKNFSIGKIFPTVDADDFLIKVEIKAIDGMNVKVHHQLEGPLVVKVIGGWKIDFSTGVFFHFNAQDVNYWFDKVPNDNADENSTDKVILRTKKNRSSITPVVGALMHIYPRRLNFTKSEEIPIYWAGIAFGLGTGEATNLSYYLGTGLMFGNNKRFLINAGVTAVNIESLLPKYKEKIDEEIEKPAEDVSIVKKGYKLRVFVSLTYNL